jgi:uncharacterized OB-fold protein
MLPIKPVTTSWSEEFWRFAQEGELRIQECSTCEVLQHPPLPMCAKCGSKELRWAPVAGVGTVFAATRVNHSVHWLLNDKIPYTVVLVDLDEGVRVVSMLDDESGDVEPSSLAGSRARVAFPLRADGSVVHTTTLIEGGD